jgi:hypothetical protein
MMEGGYFLLQHVELEQYGQPLVGLEVIRHLRPFGEDASEHVHSGFYDDGGKTPSTTRQPVCGDCKGRGVGSLAAHGSSNLIGLRGRLRVPSTGEPVRVMPA